MSKTALKLLDVYKTKDADELLYALLKQRSRRINISHRRMPGWAEHCRFIRSKPYKSWHLLQVSTPKPQIVGSVYLSKMNEIGIFLFKKFQGRRYGLAAVQALMMKNKKAGRFLANINPQNASSIAFFRRLGFKHIQNTYELSFTNKKGNL